MKYLFILISTVWLILAGLVPTPAYAAGPPNYEVQPGDTLFAIATRHGVSVDELAWANGLNSNGWLYPGQQLVIPYFSAGPAYSSPISPEPQFANAGAPTVNPLLTRPALPGWNNSPQWPAPNTIPAAWASSPTQPPNFYEPARTTPPGPAFRSTGNRNKWIDVDLTRQLLTAYEGQIPVFSSLVSSGLWQYPTVVGTFQIYVKYEQADMSGGSGEDAYYLPSVPYVMYFHGNYGLHGTYWHNSFGQPMSHGCVNLPTPVAEWLFEWASLGTQVVTHY